MMQDFSFYFFHFCLSVHYTWGYSRVCGKNAQQQEGKQKLFQTHVRICLQNFPSVFQAHCTLTSKVVIRNSLLSFSLIVSQETHMVYLVYINQHINMSNTSIMNLTHIQTNQSFIIDFSRHRMPYLFFWKQFNRDRYDESANCFF